eukprot:gene12954-14284_t
MKEEIAVTNMPVMRQDASSPTNVMKKMLSAGMGASIAEMTTIPIDTAKVRLQIQGENVKTIGSSRKARAYRGMFHTIFRVAKEEGVRYLFSGLTAGVQRQMCFCGVRIGLYDQVKKLYGDNSAGNKPKIITKILASCTTATAAVLFFQPTEVVKIRFQAAGSKARYSGTLNAYSTIARTEGMRGLWKGLSTNVARLSLVNSTEIVVYDIIKSYLLYKKWMEDSVPCHLTAAIGAGLVTTIVVSPVDVVKTRFINSRPGQYGNPIECAVKMFKQNGPTAFYKGAVPSFTRLGFWNIVMFLSYEQLKRIMKVQF